MSEVVVKAAKLMNILPETDQNLAYELIKKLVLAWDPDYVKVTPDEAISMSKAEQSGFVDENEIDWDNLSQYS